VNFARVVVDAAETSRPALVKIARDGSRGTWSMGEVASASARLAGTWPRAELGAGTP